MSRSWEILSFLFQAIPSTLKAATSRWVLGNEVDYNSEYIFGILNQLHMKLYQVINIVKGWIFRKLFVWSGGLGPKFMPFLIYPHTTIIRKPIIVSLKIFTLLKVCIETIKNNKHLKTNG